MVNGCFCAGRAVAWGGGGGDGVPGDNPVYMLATGESRVTSAEYDIVGRPLRNREEERLFNNPMYGDMDAQQYEVPVRIATPTTTEERLFVNPMYGQPDPVDYEVPVASPQASNFLLDSTTTPTSTMSVSNVYEEPQRPHASANHIN